jgi:transcription antitermination factor NusA-like protein
MNTLIEQKIEELSNDILKSKSAKYPAKTIVVMFFRVAVIALCLFYVHKIGFMIGISGTLIKIISEKFSIKILTIFK